MATTLQFKSLAMAIGAKMPTKQAPYKPPAANAPALPDNGNHPLAPPSMNRNRQVLSLLPKQTQPAVVKPLSNSDSTQTVSKKKRDANGDAVATKKADAGTAKPRKKPAPKQDEAEDDDDDDDGDSDDEKSENIKSTSEDRKFIAGDSSVEESSGASKRYASSKTFKGKSSKYDDDVSGEDEKKIKRNEAKYFDGGGASDEEGDALDSDNISSEVHSEEDFDFDLDGEESSESKSVSESSHASNDSDDETRKTIAALLAKLDKGKKKSKKVDKIIERAKREEESVTDKKKQKKAHYDPSSSDDEKKKEESSDEKKKRKKNPATPKKTLLKEESSEQAELQQKKKAPKPEAVPAPPRKVYSEPIPIPNLPTKRERKEVKNESVNIIAPPSSLADNDPMIIDMPVEQQQQPPPQVTAAHLIELAKRDTKHDLGDFTTNLPISKEDMDLAIFQMLDIVADEIIEGAASRAFLKSVHVGLRPTTVTSANLRINGADMTEYYYTLKGASADNPSVSTIDRGTNVIF